MSAVEHKAPTRATGSVFARREAQPRNDLEIQLFGLRRSGNHAIVAWLAQQYRRPVTFLNNVVPFHDPYTSYRLGSVPNAVPRGKPEPHVLETLRRERKELLVVGYEDLNLTLLQRRSLIPQREEWLGESRATRRILLLRDFYNWIASSTRRAEDLGRTANVHRQVMRWLVYAREFAGTNSYLGADAVRVAYNQWFSDAGHRETLLNRLEIPVVDNSPALVARAGGGSSFDGTAFSGKADEMDVFNRWAYLDQRQYRPVLEVLAEKRDRIDRLNEQIFALTWPFQTVR